MAGSSRIGLSDSGRDKWAPDRNKYRKRGGFRL